MAEIISLVGGLVVGLLTGYFFERRMTKATALQNVELHRQLAVLKATIYSLGGEVGEIAEERQSRGADDIATSVTARALATQDPTGRVNRGELIEYFMQRGYDVCDVETAISSLHETGTARKDGPWLQMM